ncbi:MAG: CapA family protein, partial [Cyclobacteriaceae bacterium]|nr:CapA family protein [Cyclobacteriaceae bacterium]
CLVLLTQNIFGAQAQHPLTLLFMGDIMQHDGQISAAFNPKTGQYEYKDCFKYVAPLIRDADIAFANLEVTFAGPPYKGYPQFSAPDSLAAAIKYAGIDFLVTANNHSLDGRKKGLERTLDVLDALQIPHTGTFKDSLSRDLTYPGIIEVKGYKIALLNYTYGTNGIPITPPNIVNYMDREVISGDLKKVREINPDITIAFMHWGWEYKNLPNKEQEDLAEFLMKEGVDLVIGSHPHVLQPLHIIQKENQKKKLVAYSLGNFVSNQRSRYQDGGMILEVTFNKNEEDNLWIQEAGYYLTWVYSTPGPDKSFYILPATHFEYDELLVKESINRDKMTLFLSDSRQLFKKYNTSVFEYRSFPKLAPVDLFPGNQKIVLTSEEVEEEIIQLYDPKENRAGNEVNNLPTDNIETYKVQIFASANPLDLTLVPEDFKERVTTEQISGTLKRYLVGPFQSKEKAEEALKEIRQSKSFEDAYLVTYINGKRTH